MNANEWQLIGDNEWIFGEKIRGIIRKRLAEVYYDEIKGGWIWFVHPIDSTLKRGMEGNLTLAIQACERVLKI